MSLVTGNESVNVTSPMAVLVPPSKMATRSRTLDCFVRISHVFAPLTIISANGCLTTRPNLGWFLSWATAVPFSACCSSKRKTIQMDKTGQRQRWCHKINWNQSMPEMQQSTTTTDETRVSSGSAGSVSAYRQTLRPTRNPSSIYVQTLPGFIHRRMSEVGKFVFPNLQGWSKDTTSKWTHIKGLLRSSVGLGLGFRGLRFKL